MLSFILFILVGIWLYRSYQYRKMDSREFAHSSYYEAVYSGDKKCTDQALRVLQDIGGFKRILCSLPLTDEKPQQLELDENLDKAELILMHETGIYLVETRDYEGNIEGGMHDQYWVQYIAGGSGYTGYKNYFYNPVLKNEENIKKLQHIFSDMPWIPYFSIIVFSDGCVLETDAARQDDRAARIIHCSRLSMLLYDMIRNAHKFLSPQVIVQIYDRLTKFDIL